MANGATFLKQGRALGGCLFLLSIGGGQVVDQGPGFLVVKLGSFAFHALHRSLPILGGLPGVLDAIQSVTNGATFLKQGCALGGCLLWGRLFLLSIGGGQVSDQGLGILVVKIGSYSFHPIHGRLPTLGGLLGTRDDAQRVANRATFLKQDLTSRRRLYAEVPTQYIVVGSGLFVAVDAPFHLACFVHRAVGSVLDPEPIPFCGVVAFHLIHDRQRSHVFLVAGRVVLLGNDGAIRHLAGEVFGHRKGYVVDEGAHESAVRQFGLVESLPRGVGPVLVVGIGPLFGQVGPQRLGVWLRESEVPAQYIVVGPGLFVAVDAPFHFTCFVHRAVGSVPGPEPIPPFRIVTFYLIHGRQRNHVFLVIGRIVLLDDDGAIWHLAREVFGHRKGYVVDESAQDGAMRVGALVEPFQRGVGPVFILGIGHLFGQVGPQRLGVRPWHPFLRRDDKAGAEDGENEQDGESNDRQTNEIGTFHFPPSLMHGERTVSPSDIASDMIYELVSLPITPFLVSHLFPYFTCFIYFISQVRSPFSRQWALSSPLTRYTWPGKPTVVSRRIEPTRALSL